MTYEEFEQHVLRLVYEEGVARLQPSYLAYALNLPHETVSSYLKEAMNQQVLELSFTDEGHVEYYVPGFDQNAPALTPLWKQHSVGQSPQTHTPPAQTQHHDQGRDGADGIIHVNQQVDDTDGHIFPTQAAPPRRVVIAQTTAASTAMVPYTPPTSSQALVRVDPSDDAFCDPSQTIFTRNIRVSGVQSEAILRDHIQRLFESFGYKMVNHGQERMRFERGSVTFILALVPLFVLIIPLFVYLFLYCMGRSTIQQEPLELDVQIKHGHQEESYDIELTFVGLHGVVLGAADQRVLNQEIDTLRDELNWALSAG